MGGGYAFQCGEVSELVDEHDLGSCAPKAWEFESPLPHQNIGHATPGGKTETFAHKLAAAEEPILTLDSPANANVVGMGATTALDDLALSYPKSEG